MPLLRITARTGALGDEQRQRLATELTDILLEVEVGYAADNNRKVAHVLFDDVDGATHWYAGGLRVDQQGASPGLVIFDVFYPVGATDSAAKSELHRRLNEAAARILLGEAAPASTLFSWIFIHEIAERAWGVRGRTIGIRDIASGAQVPASRVAYANAWLEAEQRVRTAHAFPESIGAAE